PAPPQPEGRMGLAGDRCVAPPRRSTPGSPSSSRLALASLPQPELEVRSLRNAARQYPCARPSVRSPRAPKMKHRSTALPAALLALALSAGAVTPQFWENFTAEELLR